MKNIWLILLALIPAHFVRTDFTVNIEIVESPPLHRDEAVYITGNFNKWDPGDTTKILKRLPNGHYGITLHLKDIPSDRLEFKFTRGDWKTLECTSKGRLEVPRVLSLNQDTSVFIHVEGWRDDYPESTASANVHVLDSSLYIPAFDDYRTVWIYLPEGYASSSERYPVMYMHDGQQMFDEATSTGRIGPIEWGVDEVIDDAEEKYIVVAINHNRDKNKRIEEYLVYPNEEHPEAKGLQYLAFIADSLKPWVDQHYRTLPDQEHTTLIGSSMGGLVSLYGGLMYPDVFGNVGVLSPSVWYDDGHIESYIQQGGYDRSSVNRQQYFFYAGSNENRRKPDGAFVQMDHDVRRVIGLLQEQVSPQIELLINPNGRHGGSYWRAVFPVFYDWLTKNEN